ncbi:hypothetical protein lbkm_2391 [Lachnospiraceae bacterium KM106-2]|nr:hypothetical protein lbkm_2391 [Lachnospiraceae bacterium KM106-2]
MDKVKAYLDNNSYALVVLHEIYGVNQFIQEVCEFYHTEGFDVYCPNLIGEEFYPYEQMETAYQHFVEDVGFTASSKVDMLIEKLKGKYDKVFLLGFSVGATIAWRCSQNLSLDGVIGFYGSRIRDNLDIVPAIPVLLLFAEQDSFSVTQVVENLGRKKNVSTYVFKAEHGFMDPYHGYYEEKLAREARMYVERFLKQF